MAEVAETSLTEPGLEARLEAHRRELTAYCYRMLGSPFEAEDAVQDTFVRAWRAYDKFESRERRARPMDLGPAQEPILSNLHTRPDESFVEPIPDALVAQDADPA